MRILDMKDNKLTVTPELLGISPFKELWEADKSKDKEVVMKQFKYMWYSSDYASPYFKYPMKERQALVMKDVIKDTKYKVSKELDEAIIKYRELTESPAIKSIASAFAFMNRLEEFFTNVDLADMKSPKTITDMFASMPKVVAALNEAKEAAEKDQAKGIKIRGGAALGMFEDG